jgi:hypothetical protein
MLLFAVGLVAMLCFQEWFAGREWFARFTDRLPHDPMSAALRIMDVAPTIVRDLPSLSCYFNVKVVACVRFCRMVILVRPRTLTEETDF